MNTDSLLPSPDDCEAVQQRISEAADSGAALAPELQAHLQNCAGCAAFAERWLHGAPRELTRQITPAGDERRLRERILDAAAAPRVIPFPAPLAGGAPWLTWAGRLAACLALAGLAWWLLDPTPTPARKRPAMASAPTLTQGFNEAESRPQHEQAVLQTAVVDGGRQVRSDIAWTVSALE